jgi:hypothetical protein
MTPWAVSELQASGQPPGENAERLAVVASEEQAVRVVPALAPGREAEAAHPRQVRGEPLRSDLEGLGVNPHRALAPLASVVDPLDQVPGHPLAAHGPADAGRPAPARVARVVARGVVDEPERSLELPGPAEHGHPPAHGDAGLLARPDVSAAVGRDHLHAGALLEAEVDRAGHANPAGAGTKAPPHGRPFDQPPFRQRDRPPPLRQAGDPGVAHAQRDLRRVHPDVAPPLQRPSPVEQRHAARRQRQPEVAHLGAARRERWHRGPVHCRLTGQST